MNTYFLSLTILLLFNTCINIEVGEVYNLPKPKREGGILENLQEILMVQLKLLQKYYHKHYGVAKELEKVYIE